jgi:hypothetical protein
MMKQYDCLNCPYYLDTCRPICVGYTGGGCVFESKWHSIIRLLKRHIGDG